MSSNLDFPTPIYRGEKRKISFEIWVWEMEKGFNKKRDHWEGFIDKAGRERGWVDL